MAVNTKNLGQVSGVYIGSTPPENIIMIWYDNTPSQMVHKVYNPGLSQWVVLDQNVISSITYSELVNIATNVGLTVGQWFKITDKSNALALAVTSTKVQYSDSLGNILIDDLGSNIQYHVSSSNLSIDDVVGVFDEVNKKLVFQFSEQVPDYTADDYILGKVKRNNVWSLAKFKLSSFLSKVTGNSITWNGGFFFNFSSAISAILDKKGGVVSKDTYDIDKQNIATDIQNVGKENQTIIENANTAISDATSATAIYNKQTPAVETGGEPTDVATGDKLITIVSKFQRYINKFKFATGIKVSNNFVKTDGGQYINNNDTVDSALRKVQGNLDKILEEDIPEVIKKGFYDYVVDSDESLARLINNENAHTVLIKNGIWNYDFGTSVENVIQLHSNTKVIHCQPNAILNISGSVSLRNSDSSQSILTYNPETINDEIKEINGLNINIILRDSPISSGNCFTYAFNSLKNLNNCNILTFNPSGTSAKGYFNCENLENCNSLAITVDCYSSCKNLKNCTGKYSSICFYQCENLENCFVKGIKTTSGYGFSACKNLDRCFAELISETNSGGNLSAFVFCERLNNCYAKFTQTVSFSQFPTCFDSCKQVINCYAYSESGKNNQVNGFKTCNQVLNCSVDDNIVSKYSSSFSTFSNTVGNECADTSAGGFNK